MKEKDMAVTTYIVDKDGNQIDSAEATSIPKTVISETHGRFLARSFQRT